MFDWLKRRTVQVTVGPLAAALGAQDKDAGDYQSLYKYLRDRYANRLVLTFAEIEAFLGFTLPTAARLDRVWWVGAVPVASRSAQSNAWTLAGRTAVVSLTAQNVVFERVETDMVPRGRSGV
jgi:hypothetical protein